MAKFGNAVKSSTFVRQKGKCAGCSRSLNELLEETEMKAYQFHHVYPDSLGGGNEEDNCVVLCGDTFSKAKDSCHYHAHQSGYYKGLIVAPPKHFTFSHAHDTARHEAWVLRWNAKYGFK